MTRRTVAGREVEVTAEGVVAAMDGVLPEPLKIHYVVVAGRRYPPKQVLEVVTGIDRSDFTTHHARRNPVQSPPRHRHRDPQTGPGRSSRR